MKEGCWLGQVDAARGGEPEPARPPAPGAALLSAPARLGRSPRSRCGGGGRGGGGGGGGRGRLCVCAPARSHCSISASRCAPPSSRLRSLAGSGPQPTLGGPGDGFLLPPSRPLPVPTLLALPHLLSFKDQGASRGARVFHNAWAARPRGAGWPARPSPPSPPSPELKGPERGAAGRAKKAALAPQTLDTRGGKLFASPRCPPPTGRRPDQKSLAVRGKWGGGGPPLPASHVHLYCCPSAYESSSPLSTRCRKFKNRQSKSLNKPDFSAPRFIIFLYIIMWVTSIIS